jgi:hypothetical protein
MTESCRTLIALYDLLKDIRHAATTAPQTFHRDALFYQNPSRTVNGINGARENFPACVELSKIILKTRL